MNSKRTRGPVARRMIWRAATIAAAGAAALVVGSTAGLAFGSSDVAENTSASSGFTLFTPASVDPALARFVAERGSKQLRMMRFTPTGVAARPDRSVTVAVRVGGDEAHAVSVRSAIKAAQEHVTGSDPSMRIASTRFNLGVSRDYQSFAKPPAVSRSLSDAVIPNLAEFRPAENADKEDSRFAARIALDQRAKPGTSPRSIDSRTDQTLDVAGSYRLTRNLDVTAGVRYMQERDRLAPQTDRAEQDSQAVYIGTQFRF